ncbi:DDE_3 domain-containing protein [Trichonephila clavipes]|uniref:DDE_3 domain-containing protein n=1 Tax=Trichonephila clavipes TaxID=2585209 RepID=A0A8X6S2D3_TRICX|nr:DDE_3 domain-containing protein [Trichonephila clavipes]
MIFYVVELLDDWNVDVPSWKYPRNLESPRVSSPGFGNDFKMMLITDLHVQSVTMIGHIYRDVILEQHVRLFRGAMGAEFLFMDDFRPHRSNIVDECIQLEDITRMDWPTYSPDLNPIEHVGVGTIGSKKCHLHEDQYKDALNRPVIEKIATSSHSSTRQCSASHGKGVTNLSLHCYYPSLACSIPDLSPVKHMWDHLGRRVVHPASLNELEARLQQIWNEMSQDIIQNLYASMPVRIAMCFRAGGSSSGN